MRFRPIRASVWQLRCLVGLTTILAACNSGDSTPVPSPVADPARQTTVPAPDSAATLPYRLWPTVFAKPVGSWTAAAPIACDELATPSQVRDDLSAMISVGPVHITAATNPITLRPPYFFKTIIVVEERAGDFVTLEVKEQLTGSPLYFSLGGPTTNAPSNQDGVTRLTLQGPFRIGVDAARGYILPLEPGCYIVKAEWTGGSGETVLGIEREK